MELIKKISEYVNYFSKIAQAISQGVKVVADNFPTDSPFSNREKTDEQGGK
jgi:hypothetical protein